MSLFLNRYPRPKKDPTIDLRLMYKNMVALIAVVTLIIVICVVYFFKQNSYFGFLTVFAVAGACYLSGGAIGFIFAIPKSAQGKTGNAQPTTANLGPLTDDYGDNTSLEEISDWLTKIVVGLGLTQFREILHFVRSAAEKMNTALQSCELVESKIDYYVFAYGVIVFYFLSGAIVGYMWTRIDFRRILSQSKRNLLRIKNLEEANSELRSDIVNKLGAADLSQTEELDDPNLLATVSAIVKNQRIRVEDDPQKNRWGGKAINCGNQLSADIAATDLPKLFKVTIHLKCLEGIFDAPVAILLHNSFIPAIRLLDARDKNVVHVEVVAYEAFTVAALTNIRSDKDFCSLELDLNELPSAPEGFKW